MKPQMVLTLLDVKRGHTSCDCPIALLLFAIGDAEFSGGTGEGGTEAASSASSSPMSTGFIGGAGMQSSS